MIYPWHQEVWSRLQSARTNERLPHALLFSGDEGCGHEALIQSFARSLLCLATDETEQKQACGSCRSCQVFGSGAHPDYNFIAAPADKQVISVDQVRGLNHFLELRCSYSPSRVVLIQEAGRMNVNAANSLLKSLEEPSPNTHILLFTSRSSALLPTIRSRCQQIRLSLPPPQQALDWLNEQQLTQQGTTLLELASGKPLHALELDNGEIIETHKVWQQQLLSVIRRNNSIAEVGTVWAGEPRAQLLDWQLNLIHYAMRHSLGSETFLSADLSAFYDSMPKQKLWAIYDQLIEMKSLATHPLNNQLFAENMLSLWLK